AGMALATLARPAPLSRRKSLHDRKAIFALAGLSQTGLGRSYPARLWLLTNIQNAMHPCDHPFLLIAAINVTFRQIFFAAGRALTNLIQDRIINIKAGPHLASSRGYIFDRSPLIPDVIIASQIVHQHQHIPGIGHGEQTASEMHPDIIAVVPAQLHSDFYITIVFADDPGPDTGKK